MAREQRVDTPHLAEQVAEFAALARAIVEDVAVRHVLIYGPPAAGKLTVAKILAERYGMTMLDNHLTFDVAVRVFDFGTTEFSDLVERLRSVLFEATATAGRDSISTFVFGHEVDRPYVSRVDETAARCGVELCRVQLCPSPAVLYERVASKSRLSTNKISDAETLSAVLTAHDLYTPIDTSDLRIDNSRLAPEEVATTIADHFGL